MKRSALITAQRLPVLGGLIPELTLRRVAAAHTIVEHFLVGSDQPGKGGELGGHVAERQPRFYRQRINSGPGKLNGVTRTP